jgi:AraC-like DNA-binding protein
MIVAVLLRELAARARIHDALRGHAAVRLCENQEELLTLVAEGLAAIVVVDLRDRSGASTLPAVHAIREGFPSVPVIGYVHVGTGASRDIIALARAGVNDLILRGIDDVGSAMRSAITSAQDQSAARDVLAMLEPVVPRSLTPFVAFCLEQARRAITVPEAAAALGVHRKTLVDRLAAAGFPTPSAMIAWCRLITAARLLEDPGRTVEQVALLLDFPSGASLRNMLKRYTGLAPGEVRENGGMRCVIHAFLRSIAPAVHNAAG